MHWGWYWKVKKKHLAKKLCSNLLFIDSFQIQKANGMRQFDILTNGTKTLIAIGYGDHFKVILGNQSHSAYRIPIDKQPCHYGSFRYYFKCPLCDKRSRILYFGEQSLFLCRKCLNLSYKSQQLRPARRFDYMADKIKKLIGEKGGDLKLNKKPPKMHNATYQLLRSKIIDYSEKGDQARLAEMTQRFGAERVSAFFDGF